jgi:hypothetical protein
LDTESVAGCKRVPAPPARMIPFRFCEFMNLIW